MSETAEKNKRNLDLEFSKFMLNANGKNQYFNRGPFKMFCSNNNGFKQISVYEWKANHWEMFSDLEGEMLISEWLEHDPSLTNMVSAQKCKQMWDYAKLSLTRNNHVIVNDESQINQIGQVVFPTLKHYLVLKNGVFHVEKPNPDYLMSYVINIDLSGYILEHQTEYVPQHYTQHGKGHFAKYIKQTFPDDGIESVVQEFVGAAFFKTSFQKCLWLYGGGSNGKSTLLTLIKEITGGYRAADLNKLGGDFDLHNLMSASIIGVPDYEPDGQGRLPEGKLKSLISGDEIPVNRKNKDVINHRFLAKWFICSNSIPHFNDKTDGWYRRFVWVNIKNQVADQNRTLNMDQLIIKHDMLCFFDWVLSGAVKVEKRGHIIPDSELPMELRNIKAHIRFQNNSVAQWLDLIDLRSTDDQSDYSVKNEIYEQYRDFCQDSLHKEPVGVEKFWSEMDRQFSQKGTPIESIQKMVKGKRNYYCNITTKPIRTAMDDMNVIPFPDPLLNAA